MPPRLPLLERFWQKVSAPLLPNGDRDPAACWIWTGARSRSRSGRYYGHLRLDAPSRKHIRAHKVSYQLHVADLDDGRELDHTCSNTLCVNPDHLRLVTHYENMQAVIARDGKIAGKPVRAGIAGI